jgi:hypothetical protein
MERCGHSQVFVDNEQMTVKIDSVKSGTFTLRPARTFPGTAKIEKMTLKIDVFLSNSVNFNDVLLVHYSGRTVSVWNSRTVKRTFPFLEIFLQ